MKINDSLPPSITPSQQTGGAAPLQRDASVTGTPADNGGYTASAELVRLISLAGQEPEIREDRVAAVLLKLQGGAYNTADVVAKTADAMLNGVD
jgi:hypothetical protein